jgi:hypothetical protein
MNSFVPMEKPFTSAFLGGEFINFRPKVWDLGKNKNYE